jgi:hypothetical protein
MTLRSTSSALKNVWLALLPADEAQSGPNPVGERRDIALDRVGIVHHQISMALTPSSDMKYSWASSSPM